MAQAQWARTRRGESAAVADDRRLRLEAEVLIARHALPAVHATAGRPADADALADLQPLGRRSDRGHPADDFVPQHGRVIAKCPIRC